VRRFVMGRFRKPLLGMSLSVLGASLLAIGLVTALGSTSPLPASVLGWEISLSNVVFQRFQPNDQLFTMFDLSVMPSQSDSYKLEKIAVATELWKFRIRTADGTEFVEEGKVADGGNGDFSVASVPSFSIAGAALRVIQGICQKLAGELSSRGSWGSSPWGPADGFVVVFRFDVKGGKEGVLVKGGATFTVPLDHQALCGD
jgi:hypothetical protein